ncbi:CIA30 family protein [Roseobacter weihaiensis]|uniref:CIA30 family protein n=1 Tax=Roseobacter weihaiensis TaxID=2763262 RepID=UPI001D0B86DF|nr:CIA30 family protein [Roseobacter sp. H9]
MELSPRWEYVSDRVMGGVSEGQLRLESVKGQRSAHLTGRVSLDNNGGFVQMAFDIAADGRVFDASDWAGIALDVLGNGERYEIRLRTAQLTRPWQSFRAEIVAIDRWQTLYLPFEVFEAHRTQVAFDPAALRRIGVLGIGRVFDADIAVGGLRLYR